MSGSGIGNIIGSYFAYSRFVDRFGNFSNLSPVSAQLDARGGRTIQVTNASNSASGTVLSSPTGAGGTPIVCNTATPHGRATNDILKITGALGDTAMNGTWTITVVTATQFRLNGSTSNGVYVNNSATWKLQIPITITTAVAHLINVGATVVITGVVGNTDANGTWTVLTVPSGTTFAINQTSGGNANYVSGGIITTGTTGIITDASPTTPITITSNGHGLTTGLIVKVSGVLGNEDANGTWEVTVLDQNRFNLNGSSGIFAFSPSPNAIWTSGCLTITYTGFPVPVEPKVVRRQILRNTDGQATTFYVDVDTTSLLTTTATSTRSDSQLSAQEAVPFFDVEGNDIVNIYTVPPNWKCFPVAHQDRMFYFGEVPYSEGNVAVTNGSTTVTAINASWPVTFANRFIYIDGAPKPYEIASASGSTLTLTEAYGGATSTYSFYSIRPAPAERRICYYSEAGLAEAVPVTNGLSIEEDGDDFTGGFSYRSFVFLLERRHIHRLTFQTNPARDGVVYMAKLRGCINNRCWAITDDGVYMLDEQGVHLFDGGEGGGAVSDAIQSVFRSDPNSLHQINWSSQRFFHCLHYQTQGVIRWFVALSGDYLPRHALCFSYLKKRWWIEEFKVPVGASCVGRIGPQSGGWGSGTEQCYLGSQFREVLAYWVGQLDGATGGSERGTATSGGFSSLTDSSASFLADTIGLPVTITSGRGKGQTRIVSARTSTKLTFSWPWMIVPDDTSKYQIGGVPWVWSGGSHQLAMSEADQQRSFDVSFIPTKSDMTFDMRRFVDQDEDPENMGIDQTGAQEMEVATQRGDPDMVVALSKRIGYAKKALSGRREESMDGIRRVTLELRGVTGPDPVTIFRLGLEGVEK